MESTYRQRSASDKLKILKMKKSVYCFSLCEKKEGVNSKRFTLVTEENDHYCNGNYILNELKTVWSDD